MSSNASWATAAGYAEDRGPGEWTNVQKESGIKMPPEVREGYERVRRRTRRKGPPSSSTHETRFFNHKKAKNLASQIPEPTVPHSREDLVNWRKYHKELSKNLAGIVDMYATNEWDRRQSAISTGSLPTMLRFIGDGFQFNWFEEEQKEALSCVWEPRNFLPRATKIIGEQGAPCCLRGDLLRFWWAIYLETGSSGWITTRGALYYSQEELKEVFNKFHDNTYHSPALPANYQAYWDWMGTEPAPGKKDSKAADKENFYPWPTGTTVADTDRIAGLRAEGCQPKDDVHLYKHFVSFDRFGCALKWDPKDVPKWLEQRINKGSWGAFQ